MTDKPFEVRIHDVHLDSDYAIWLKEVKTRYRAAQVKAAVKVNSEQLLFNWQLGRDLVALRAEEKWGNGIVEQVSLDLQDAFPGVKGFSVRNLWYMKQWYLFYSSASINHFPVVINGEVIRGSEKLHQAGAETEELHQLGAEMPFPPAFAYVPWRHHVEIITKCKTTDEALFYIRKTIEEGWSRNTLGNCLHADLYHTQGAAITNFSDRLPQPQGDLAADLIKGNYDLGFLTLPEKYDEEKLETAIEHQMTRFLLELGSGWAFVGRQKELVVAGKTRRLDLLFYHIHYRFYLVIELKVKPFEPEFAGKLNFYVNAVNDLIRTENDNPTIGLLVCRDMERTEVQYALQGIETPIGVATYSNVKIEEIQAQLPTVDQINACIERAEEELSREDSSKEKPADDRT